MAVDARVVSAEVQVLRAPVNDGIAMSFAPLADRSMVVVELRAASGIVGRGESWVNFPSWAPQERIATLRYGVVQKVLCEDPREVMKIQQRLKEELEPLGRQWGAPGPIMQSISAVDIALWDLYGRIMSISTGRLLGSRTRDCIPIYASSLGPERVAEQAERCKRDGFTAAKLKVGFGRRTDEANLERAREVLGDKVMLYVDANQAWTISEALAMAPVLATFGVALVEEPIVGDDLTDLEHLYHETGLSIATGENIYGFGKFRSYLESPAVAVIQPDITKAGGLTETFAIAEYASTCGKAVLPHVYGGAIGYAAALQLAACAPAVRAVEYDIRVNPLRDPLLINPPRPQGSSISLPDLPGLGLDLNPEAMTAWTTDRVAVDYRRSTAKGSR